ncbi:hypothetical protein [Parenemella sanctibonifatiensis]|uniref:Uncharacterized protein n=1 Tax=Parenemella sanctibonifatiensis TaxID=2016505 RepID=A0A255EL80_9ACTN|nr:hypothetical protein [Parenemella sanctibonifatiensis]OYN91980.1 hypothetical protein CGZ91_00135 [Parenemella sanctibonifatiensis]
MTEEQQTAQPARPGSRVGDGHSSDQPQSWRHRVTSRRSSRPYEGLREDNEPVVDRFSSRAAHEAVCDDEAADR